MARLRYEIFSEIAEEEGFKNVARLFKAISYSELIHAKNHYKNLSDLNQDLRVVARATFGPGDTRKNLGLAIRGEIHEVEEMYPSYLTIAIQQGERKAELSFRWALEAEKIHVELYQQARRAVNEGKDLEIDGKIWICSVCGHTTIGSEPPERCPICKASKEKYRGF